MVRYTCALMCLLIALSGCSSRPPEYDSKYTPPSTQPSASYVAVVGNAYTRSAPESDGAETWPALVTAQLLEQNINLDLEISADANMKGAPAVADARTIPKQVRKSVLQGTKLVIFFGSVSDPAGPASDISVAVRQGLAGAQRSAPTAALLVIGPAWANGAPPPNVLAARDALKAVASAAPATFVDPIAENWFTDQPNLFAPDNLTLTDAGHSYLAAKMAPLIVQQLQAPPPTPAPSMPTKKKKQGTP